MLTVILTVCALNALSQCGEGRLTFQGDAASPLSCTNQALPHVREFVTARPNLRVTKWRCKDAKREGSPA